MAVDILNIKPTVISKDLRGKFVMLYSSPKGGKTTMACSFPKNLLCAFEKGYNAISGAMAVDITKWVDFKQVIRQLRKQESKEKFHTITIDTASIAYDLCEQYVCAQNGVQAIGDVLWGQGYAATKKEFENCLREITQLGYGLVLITHEEVKKEPGPNDTEIEVVRPALNKRAYEICNRLVDIIGYIQVEWKEDGSSERWLVTRRTPTIMAGSRFKYMPPRIKFGYEELVNAITEAIKESEEKDGAVVVDKAEEKVEEVLDYNKLMDEAKAIWSKLVPDTEESSQEMAKTIHKKVEMIFGKPTKISDITEDQIDLLNLVVLELRDLNK